MRAAMTTIAVLALGLSAPASAAFSQHFGDWLNEHFGEDVRRHLERLDLGPGGSFGGKNDANQPVNHQPVIFVHGVSTTAGDMMLRAADHFRANHGYTNAELYGTTYANGNQGNPLQWAQYQMDCHYVKLVRALVVAVRLYTGRAVDVVGYSLGVPTARKAILGGRCVDTGEDLGAPLTRFVDTFVGVAGPNHGIALQVGGIQVPGCVFSLVPICNTRTGLYSGICPAESDFLQDINRQAGYEAAHRFSIYSQADQIVGHTVCNRITSQVPGQEGQKVFVDKNHDNTFYDSFDTQYNMVELHRAE